MYQNYINISVLICSNFNSYLILSIYIRSPHLQLMICDPALENRAYVHTIHPFILFNLSHLLCKLYMLCDYIKCSSVYFTSCKYFNDKLIPLLGTKLQNFKVQKVIKFCMYT